VYLRYWARSAELPNDSRKITVGRDGVRKMVKNDDWSDFVKAAGTNTTRYNAIMIKWNGETPGAFVDHNNLIFHRGYEEGYGHVWVGNAGYQWADLFGKRQVMVGDRVFPEGGPISLEGLESEPPEFPDLDELRVIEPPTDGN
jgi:hypothetical protein